MSVGSCPMATKRCSIKRDTVERDQFNKVTTGSRTRLW
jgi:hypothetical protein